MVGKRGEEPWNDDRITLFGLFLESYQRMSAGFAKDLEAECGLAIAPFEVLLRIARHGEGAPTMSELAEAVAFTSGGLTRLADRLERDGLVERCTSPTDRRVVLLRLTDDGREVLSAATEVHVAGIQRELLDRLTAKDAKELERILRLVRTH